MAFDYTSLVTNQYRRSPNFLAVVAMLTEGLGLTADVNLSAVSYYDVDTAVGAQLDVIGLWVGASRSIEVPFDNWFSFDIAGKGFDEGIWRGAFDPPGGLQKLDDVSYRRLIKACIAADHWDGTLWNYHEVLDEGLPHGNEVKVTDNFDMTITIHVTGPKLSPLMEALLTVGRLSQIKPAGVAIDSYVLPP